MTDIYSAAAMKRIDGYAIYTLKIPSTTLMETAAGRVFDAVSRRFGPVEGSVCAVFCGSGNNGGDGLAIARLLMDAGASVRCFLVGKREKFTPDTAEMADRLIAVGGVLEDFEKAGDIAPYLARCGLVIDAMFGIGLNTALRAPAADAAGLINACGAKVIAVDIASGVETDTGKILGCAVKADLTVTFTAPKAGHLLPPGGLYCGELEVVDIGIPAEAVATESPFCRVMEQADTAANLPPRRADAHKGDFGRILLVCGSVGYTGAATLAARAALRSGGGLVSLGVPQAVYAIAAMKNDEAMVFPLPCDEGGKLSFDALGEILSRLEKADVCLLGPGLGQSGDLDRLIWEIVSRSTKPLVIDADGINALSRNIDMMKKAACPLVLTPHDGEFARLGGDTSDRVRNALAFAAAHNCHLVLKGHRTVTASPDGLAVINTTGNPGMATGGSGDVLAGVIAALIGQKLPPFQAAATGVFIHGQAGDLCAGRIGQYGMLPTDMINALPGLLP